MRYLYECFPAAIEVFGSGKFKFSKHMDTPLTYIVSLGICGLDYAKMWYTKNVLVHRIQLSRDAVASIKIVSVDARILYMYSVCTVFISHHVEFWHFPHVLTRTWRTRDRRYNHQCRCRDLLGFYPQCLQGESTYELFLEGGCICSRPIVAYVMTDAEFRNCFASKSVHIKTVEKTSQEQLLLLLISTILLWFKPTRTFVPNM